MAPRHLVVGVLYHTFNSLRAHSGGHAMVGTGCDMGPSSKSVRPTPKWTAPSPPLPPPVGGAYEGSQVGV